VPLVLAVPLGRRKQLDLRDQLERLDLQERPELLEQLDLRDQLERLDLQERPELLEQLDLRDQLERLGPRGQVTLPIRSSLRLAP
jgi:hypothetical protein